MNYKKEELSKYNHLILEENFLNGKKYLETLRLVVIQFRILNSSMIKFIIKKFISLFRFFY